MSGVVGSLFRVPRGFASGSSRAVPSDCTTITDERWSAATSRTSITIATSKDISGTTKKRQEHRGEPGAWTKSLVTKAEENAEVPEACSETEMHDLDCCCEQEMAQGHCEEFDLDSDDWSQCLSETAAQCKELKGTPDNCYNELTTPYYQQHFKAQISNIAIRRRRKTGDGRRRFMVGRFWNVQAAQERANKQHSPKQWTSRMLLTTRGTLDSSVSAKCDR